MVSLFLGRAMVVGRGHHESLLLLAEHMMQLSERRTIAIALVPAGGDQIGQIQSAGWYRERVMVVAEVLDHLVVVE